MASLHPGMTAPTPKVAGSPREYEESNILPSVVQPAYWTTTLLAGVGWTVPVPFVSTFVASPSFSTIALPGGFFTSEGVFGPERISTSSITMVTSPAGAPCRAGNARAAGTQSVRFSPTTISCTPSAQPSEKPDTGRADGLSFDAS